MARKGKARISGKPQSARTDAGASSGKRIENYEDTLEEGGVDEFMLNRDQIMFDDINGGDDNDDLEPEGDEVLGLPDGRAGSDDMDETEVEETDLARRQEKRKAKATGAEMLKRGRFAKEELEELEEEAEASGSGSDVDEDGWGRQYYSRPSNRRAREDPTEFEASREEERDLEEQEVKRLQSKSRKSLLGVEDWGFDTTVEQVIEPEEPVSPFTESVTAPETADPAVLLRHMETHETLKLALAREFPLVVAKLQKTARGMKTLHENGTSEGTLQKGLGWLHYQTLLTYASVLAFYIHLCSLSRSSRPSLSNHPILTRLLHLKEGLAMLEDLDFAAGSVTDGEGEEDAEEDEAALYQAKRELMLKMLNMAGGAEEDEAEGEGSDADLDNSWKSIELEDGELADLLADAGGVEGSPEVVAQPKFKSKAKGSGKKEKGKKEERGAIQGFGPLAEPDFKASKVKRPALAVDDDDVIGDPTSLGEADAGDKDVRKRSLQFHTSKINSTSARRAAARVQRFGGDDDIPQRDRQAARDAALRRNAPQPQSDVVNDLDADDWNEDEKEVGTEQSDADGYYELIRRSKDKAKQAKNAAHEEALRGKQLISEEAHEGGPRALTRAIEKNRGLTPRRSKSGRNPRVKKRLAYDKAKKKVGSQGPVFKGGQSSLRGSYSGETSGISSSIRSKSF